jgi:hypothetical protein
MKNELAQQFSSLTSGTYPNSLKHREMRSKKKLVGGEKIVFTRQLF